MRQSSQVSRMSLYSRMANVCPINISYTLFIFSIVLVDYVNSHRDYPLPINHINDEHYSIKANICHPLGPQSEHLKIGINTPHNSSIILRLIHIFDRWINHESDLECKFVVKVRKDEYLMAVIQNMAFRKNEHDECIDYVMFRSNGHHSPEKYCGVLKRHKPTNSSDYPAAVYGLYDVRGEIETTIFVSKESLQTHDIPLNLTIIYTPFKHEGCNHINYDETYKLNQFVGEIKGCIAEDYFCDGYQNCIPSLCRDEEDCNGKVFSNDTQSNVTMGAVTTILLSFILSLIGLWICRRQKKLFWSSDCAGPDINDDRINNVECSSLNSVHQTVPTAPMLEASVMPSPIDKDLPPSYDSLFPEYTNPSSD